MACPFSAWEEGDLAWPTTKPRSYSLPWARVRDLEATSPAGDCDTQLLGRQREPEGVMVDGFLGGARGMPVSP